MPRRVERIWRCWVRGRSRQWTATGRLLRRSKADVLLGFGGYVSTPAYLAARRLEVAHCDPRTKRAARSRQRKLAARLTSNVHNLVPQTAPPHAQRIGLPIRRAITDLDRIALQPEARIGFEPHPEPLPTLLVSGGSQGAMRINTAVSGAWPELLAHGIQVLHVLGPKTSRAASCRKPRRADRGRLPDRWRAVRGTDGAGAAAAADLMLARCSGANTVLETAAVGPGPLCSCHGHNGNGRTGPQCRACWLQRQVAASKAGRQ